MKFIAKYIQAIGLLMLTGFVAAAAALYFDAPKRMVKPAVAASAAVVADLHAGCNHSAPAQNDSTKPAATGCGHADAGCCSSKTKIPSASASAGGCTRNLVHNPDNSSP